MFNPYEYTALTKGIEVTVRPFYAEELSQPASHKYVYVYKVSIKNNSQSPVKLVSREWHIVEEDGTAYNITGEGVIGKQPVIEIGAAFEYASQAILYSKTGIMYGTYNCINLTNSENIEVSIPAFSLDLESKVPGI